MLEGFANYLKENPALSLLLISHILGDFHLQSPRMARKKSKEPHFLIAHLTIVNSLLIVIGLLAPSLWLSLLVVGLSHSLIDLAKPRIEKGLRLSAPAIFTLDQILHLAIILLVATKFSQGLNVPTWLSVTALNNLLFFLLITKPVNVAFRIFFSKYQPEEDPSQSETIQGAGSTIGLLERVVIGICIALGQFASIGLVFTAKSIARYNKISENPAFAEYYLIGSLFSILSVLVAAWICLM